MVDQEQFLNRAQSLMDVDRYDMALKELEKTMELNPDNGQAWLLMLICYTKMGRIDKAIDIARQLLSVHPEEPLIYFLLALNLVDKEELKEAEEIALAGLNIAPNYVNLFGVLGRIHLIRKDWEKALEYANEGLAIDPSAVDCLNIRVKALTQLGRKEELKASMEDTLSAAPNNPYTHNNIGWSKLQSGDHQGAKEHFAEALRINPNLEDARVGLLEALKAKNFFYRIFLNWMFWMAKKTEGSQWFIVIGLYFGARYLNRISSDYPFLIPVVVLLAIAFYMTWVMTPLFNLFIKMDKTARHALTPEESSAANIVGVGVLVGSMAILTYAITGLDIASLVAIFALSIVIPSYMYFNFKNTTHEMHAKVSVLSFWGLGGLAMTGTLLGLPWAGGLWTLYFLGFIGYQFVVNYWNMKKRPLD
jgi:tetratricopeptide (TPR) repeat protein